MLDNSISLSQCRKGDFALGIGGSYLARNADTEYDGHDLDNPDFLVVFSRSVSRTLSLGASFSHVEHKFAFSRGGSDSAGHVLLATDETFSGNRVQIGLKGKFGSRLTVRYGLHIGYERLRITRSYSNWLGGASWETTYHSHLPWVSEQILVQLERLLWLGTEVRVRFLNDAALGKGRHYRYYYRLRGVWSPSSTLRIGGFYCDGDSFTETHEPLLSYFSSIRQERYLREWGMGVAWRCHQRLLAGAEYRVGEYPEPVSNSFPWILPGQMKINSLHLGVEGQLTTGLSIRGGFITSLGDPGRTYTYWAYDFEPSAVTWVYRKDSRENTVTLGCGLEPSNWNVVLEFSYRYTFKSYRDWYLEGEDVKSRASLLTFSFERKL
ncbi:MAG: hypothetical protein GTO24_17635 [candidate division Zixibacteria bacterium]|nr:hypothetical protein [candidate division Zixibacteria bacterium]